MGVFGSLFSGFFKGVVSSKPLSTFYANSKGSSDQGIALDRFNSIIDAHSSVEEIVEEFDLAGEDCEYQSLDGYANCYEQAYLEALMAATAEAEALAAVGIEVDPEELIDWDEVYQNAYDYALQLAEAWLDGSEWIPEEVLDWAWYEVSDHNF